VPWHPVYIDKLAACNYLYRKKFSGIIFPETIISYDGALRQPGVAAHPAKHESAQAVRAPATIATGAAHHEEN
jgi:hypothetical protein